MICKPCAIGGDHNATGDWKSAIEWHKQCIGHKTHCDCQHKVGEGLIKRDEK